MSPTRELAEQIAVEAKKLAKNTGITVQVAVGGNSKRAMLQQMQREGCHLLVATPGRLYDLLSDPYHKVAAPHLNTFIMDEADRLLDEGFTQEIEQIMRYLPPIGEVDRQTLLFSATVPKEVASLVRKTLKPGFEFVKTVRDDEPATHERVPQKLVTVTGIENIMPAVVELCKRNIDACAADRNLAPFKAIVYYSSTANVELAAAIFKNLRPAADGPAADGKSGRQSGRQSGRHFLHPAEISEMHGQLTQVQRTRVSDRFRRATSAIMFSTDVTARGMDFPGVTHVIQVGTPPNREQYIHRLGRTARGDAAGEGWMFVTVPEGRDIHARLRGMPLDQDLTLEAAKVDMTGNALLPVLLAEILKYVSVATKGVDRDLKQRAYMAMLGTSHSVRDKQAMMDSMKQWTRYGFGWTEPPFLGHQLADKLRLTGLRGVQVGHPGFRNTDQYDKQGRDIMRRHEDKKGVIDRDARDRDLEQDLEQEEGAMGGGSSGGRSGGGSRGGDRGGRPRRDHSDQRSYRGGRDGGRGGFSRGNDRGRNDTYDRSARY